ncbi:hypothetical protein BHE90_015031 [Fusarium euwallaceae]|uniref:Uncharacterized protein n=4 Tax=Fusarium solani species complex TaxID=232080 RepID=A0A3M2S0Z7_9HYPO|nr:hypothetical protein CDV36_009347 [Fusarium kuroshium]RSL62114.1 hypothetical protein CEP51_013526 [Fusarium floridanum]RSM13414.1 hypothetical protein CEP52_001927 [Fusarium oligoseptatum]RTE70579.1 hypothetical protein BHE90_015031 [Fusarium euwallaceae]
MSAPTQSKMLVVPPALNLRRAGSYNPQDRGPLSSTTSRFNFNHLLFSPPPSPALPALVPRPPKRTSSQILVTRPSRVFRRLFLLGVLLSIIYVMGLAFQNPDAIPAAVWPYFGQEEFEMVGQYDLPDFPTPILISDNKGRSKWTISIPPKHDFPLTMEQYAEMGSQCREVSSRARDLHRKAPITEQEIVNYDAQDDYFVDIYEAERSGLLPPGKGMRTRGKGKFVGLDKKHMKYKPVCESSMTFVLETSDAGLGNTLMMLWTFYGLAKQQGRDFFIVDSRWAYGPYTEIFDIPPVPDCRPPPRHHMVPCPFQARHLVVSAATAKEVFPALLAKNHRIAGTDNPVKDLFQLARTGFEDLFSLSEDDQAYVDNRVVGLQAKAKMGDTLTTRAPIVGLHIRHGDQHPLEFQYRDNYIPAEVFLKQVEQFVDEHYNASELEDPKQHHYITLLASDDPTVKEEPQFSNVILSQDRIRLASKGAIDQAHGSPELLHNFVEKTFGWEGGFFAPMFWNLGVDSKNNAAEAPAGVNVQDVNEEARHMAPPSEETLRLRSLIGRAYMMDLAVLSESSDKIVCAVSAMGCRLLAVMMGWEDAMEKDGWKNVDGSYGWTGIDW